MEIPPITIMILAGGQGSRFWPASRATLPKQFLELGASKKSLIQSTVERLEGLVERENIVVITAADQKELVEEHVPGVKILAEPYGRNTAAALALGARWLETQGFSGVMIALPADHAVSNPENLITTLKRAAHMAWTQEQLVTIGIVPERPDTAFGYIERGDSIAEKVFGVQQFCEKPDIERATEYVSSGDFFWNSGMFVWRPEVFLSEIKEYLPEMYQQFSEFSCEKGGLPSAEVLSDLYGRVEAISVDVGIMERSDKVLMVEADPYGWSDVGSWDAWADYFESDEVGNVLRGDSISLEGKGNLVSSSSGRFIALLGAEDLVVIDSPDALLVCHRSRVQDVKKVVEYLKEKGRSELV